MNDPLAHEIVARFHAGASMRRIAQSLRISRGRVRRVLQEVEHARTVGTTQGLPQLVLRRGSQLDAYDTAITDLLAAIPISRPKESSRNCAGLVTRGATQSRASGCGRCGRVPSSHQ